MFHRYPSIDCTGTAVNQTVTLAADGTAETSSFTALADMSYKADYSGDATYPARSGACEPLIVRPETPCPEGLFTTQLQSNGDLLLIFDQYPAPSDNSYGANAVGWGSGGHTFSNLVTADHAGFTVSQNGTAKLDFNVDYLSSTSVSSTNPSGYTSLGPFGGDGSVNVGTLTTSDVTWDTSLSRDLNKLGYFSNGTQTSASKSGTNGADLLVNSPPTESTSGYDLKSPNPWNGASTNPDGTVTNGWDFHNTYYVTLKAAKLVALGAENSSTHQLNSGWTFTQNLANINNSPAKACTCACNFKVKSTTFSGKEVRVQVQNQDSFSSSYLTSLNVAWPSGTDGKLMQVKVDGNVIYETPDISGSSATLSLSQLNPDASTRKWEAGGTHTVTFVFEKNVDTNLANYSGWLKFDDTCKVSIL